MSAPRFRGPSTGRPRSTRRRSALVIAVAVVGGVVAARPANFVPAVTILDVGRGSGILVEGSRGGRLSVERGALIPIACWWRSMPTLPPWDRRIDTLILTHPHEDHVAGLALLLDRYHVGRVFEPGMVGPGPGYAALGRRLARSDAPIRGGIAAGDRLQVDDPGVWPNPDGPTRPPDGGTGINNVSVVLLGQVGSRRFLLMGDVSSRRSTHSSWSRACRMSICSRSRITAARPPRPSLVDAVRPRVAVALAGAGNPYGHPAKATLDRLAAAGARVLRTDRDGTVVFEPSA